MTVPVCVCIIVCMNVYITHENEELLRQYASLEKQSMSGLLNKLIQDYFKDSNV